MFHWGIGMVITQKEEAFQQPMLSREVEQDLLKQWKFLKARKALDKLVRAHARLAFSVAMRYDRNPAHVQDLAQYGMMGLMKAADKFEFHFETRFATYARRWVMTYVAQSTSETAAILDIPARLYLKARAADNETNEISAEAIKAASPMVPLDAPISDENDATLIETIRCHRPNAEQILENDRRQSFFERKLQEAMDAVLNTRERDVMTLRCLVDPVKTLEEIATIYGITRERVRQIEFSAKVKVRKFLLSDDEALTLLRETEAFDLLSSMFGAKGD